MELLAGADPELSKHLAQMPLHRARAEEMPRRDLRVRQPIAGELGDLSLLRGQIVARLNRPFARTFSPVARSSMPRALGERLHADRGKRLVGAAKLLASVDPAVLPAQPLPVEQTRPGELRTGQVDPAARPPGDRDPRLARAICDESERDAERPNHRPRRAVSRSVRSDSRSAASGHVRSPLEPRPPPARIAVQDDVTMSSGPGDRLPRRLERHLVLAEAVVQDRLVAADGRDRSPLAPG